ncbi:MAG: hypothetical protein KGJ33_03255, partial [Patescibacteria group bacterium]|nr:hypothetical protein [Patescibacteria group bacterium]
MLYVFHGDNLKLSIEKAHTLIDQLLAKRPEAAFEKMSAENWNAAALESHLGGQGLFLNKYIVFLDRLSENTEAREKLLEFIPVLKESANIFIVLEGLLNAEFRKTLETYAEKAVASDMEKPKKSWGTSGAKGDFNIFALA